MDPTQFEQVLVNLALNACDAFEELHNRGETVHFIQKPLSSTALAEKVRGILADKA